MDPDATQVEPESQTDQDVVDFSSIPDEQSEHLPANLNDSQLEQNKTQLIATEETPEKISSQIDEVESDQPELNTKDSAKRRRIDVTPIQIAPESAGGQQAVLPTSTTPLEANSTEGHLETNKSAVEAKKQSASVPVDNDDAEVYKSGGNRSELSISTLSDRFAKESPSQLLPDVIKLMEDQMENVDVQMSCLQLTNKYPYDQLQKMDSSLKRRLVQVLLSSVKRHGDNSFIVNGFCDFFGKIFAYERYEIGLIGILLDLIGDENKMTTAAKISMLKLLETTARNFGLNEKDLIGDRIKAVEKICGSIALQLTKLDSEYDEFMTHSWELLVCVCKYSVANTKRFLDAGGLSLLRHCHKKFNPPSSGTHDHLVWQMADMLGAQESIKERICQDLRANGNLEILWEIWSEAKSDRISSECAKIFTHFLYDCSPSWPLVTPTKVEVEEKFELEKGKKTARGEFL